MEENHEKTAYLEFSDVEKKHSSLVSVLIIVLVAAIIGALGYFGYKKFTSKSPKELYEANIKNAVKKVNNNIDMMSKFYQSEIKGTVKVEGLLFTMSGLDVLNDYEFTLANKVDENNKIALTNLVMNDTKNKNKFDATMYVKDGDIYLDLKDTYDGIVKLTTYTDEETKVLLQNALSDYSSNNYAKFTYLLDKVSTLYIETLDDSDFKEEEKTVTVNGKQKKLTATSVVYTAEKAKNTLKHIIKGLLEDEVSISYLASISSTSVEEVKEALNEMLEDETDPEGDETLKVVIYSKNSKFAGMEMSVGDEAVTYFDIDKDIELNINNGLKAVGSYAKGGTITVSYASEDDLIELLTLTVNKYEKDSYDVDYKLSDKLFASSDMKMSISGNIKGSKSTSGTVTNQNVQVSLVYDVQGMSSKVTATIESVGDSKPANIDVDLSGAKEADDELLEEIEEKALEKFTTFSIYQALSQSLVQNEEE